MSKKRLRDKEGDVDTIKQEENLPKRPKVDLALAAIFDHLSNENEETRLQAAYDLIKNHLSSPSLEQATSISKRLFRGLSSSRKCARPGFYGALLGALSIKPHAFGSAELKLDTILDILRRETTAELETSKQDDRDHLFGRVLGCSAVVRSNVFLRNGRANVAEWKALFSELVGCMAQKTWLRRECASVLGLAIEQLARTEVAQILDATSMMADLISSLKVNRLLYTIDGLQVWLHARESLPVSKLPQNCWEARDPLNTKELNRLKKVLLDSQTQDVDGVDVEGNSKWLEVLHPVWKILLRRYSDKNEIHKQQIPFTDVWATVVDQGYFGATSSPERKYTGFLILQEAVCTVDSNFTKQCFSKNIVSCMIQVLRSPKDEYLRSVLRNIINQFQSWCFNNHSGLAERIALGLLEGCQWADFDVISKSSLITKFCRLACDKSTEIMPNLMHILKQTEDTPADDEKTSNNKTRMILDVVAKTFSDHFPPATAPETVDWNSMEKIVADFCELDKLSRLQHNSLKQFFTEKKYHMFECLLRNNERGQIILLRILSRENASITDGLQADPKIITTIRDAARKLKAILDRDEFSVPSDLRAIALLYATLLDQIQQDDMESVESLQDLDTIYTELWLQKKKGEFADQLVETVMELVSKPSRFLRRIGSWVFENFAPRMSMAGLESLRGILLAKEGKEGQSELFNGADDLTEDESAEESVNESGQELDSDVEVVSEKTESISGSNEEDESSTSEDSDSDADMEADDLPDNLDDLENALADALGTRKLRADDLDDSNLDGSSSDTDSDMSDDAMLDLDAKLSEVFAHQIQQTSTQKIRREENRSAKENVVNLKNRALDLFEIFLKKQAQPFPQEPSQQTRSEQERQILRVWVLSLLVTVADATESSQIMEKAARIVKTAISRARIHKPTKQVQDQAPPLTLAVNDRTSLDGIVTTLLALASNDKASNTVLRISSQVLLTVCRFLLAIGVSDVARPIRLEFGKMQVSGAQQERKAYKEFWNRFDDWARVCQPASGNVATLEDAVERGAKVAGSTKTEGNRKQKMRGKGEKNG